MSAKFWLFDFIISDNNMGYEIGSGIGWDPMGLIKKTDEEGAWCGYAHLGPLEIKRGNIMYI